jgi:hypothetical protein
MSAPRKSINVTRTYSYEEGDCVRALALLLNKSACKQGGPTTAPKDDVKEFHGYVATENSTG